MWWMAGLPFGALRMFGWPTKSVGLNDYSINCCCNLTWFGTPDFDCLSGDPGRISCCYCQTGVWSLHLLGLLLRITITLTTSGMVDSGDSTDAVGRNADDISEMENLWCGYCYWEDHYLAWNHRWCIIADVVVIKSPATLNHLHYCFRNDVAA